MPFYFYKAKKENAETVSGEIAARDHEEAVELISRMGLLPVQIDERAAPAPVRAEVLVARTVRTRDVLAFTRQLVSLLKSGIAVLQAIEILSTRTKNKRFAQIISDMAQNIRNGHSFSTCLSQHPEAFPDMYVAMARAGEESGKLRELLNDVASYYKKQEEITTRIRTALTYPIFMALVGAGTVIFILSFVLPRIMVLFKDLHATLPWPTLVVMKMSSVVQHSWPWLFGLAFIGLIAWRALGLRERAGRIWGNLLFRFPLTRNLVLKIDLERFARTTGLLLDSGIPILRALEISIPILSNDALIKDLRICQVKIEGGAGFGETLRESPLVPEIVSQLVTIGEESGELGSSLKDIADTYQGELDETTRAFMTLIEPLLILVVGAVVAFLVFAMLMPIFQMDIFAS